MAQSSPVSPAAVNIDRLQRLRNSLADFKALLNPLPADFSSAEYNHQFNELRLEARTLLKGQLTNVPSAGTGDINAERSVSIVVILGTILALTGLGLNSIILDDVIINSIGCCVSSGGMFFVVGAFFVLLRRHRWQRVSSISDLRQRCDLILYQVDQRIQRQGGSGPY